MEFDFLVYDLWFLHECLFNAIVHLTSSGKNVFDRKFAYLAKRAIEMKYETK